MDVILYNFFNLLRSGAFTDNQPLKPMSAFKWRRLYRIVEVQDVPDIFLHGLKCHNEGRGLNIPAEIITQAERASQNVKDLEGFSSREVKMSFGLLNSRYQSILNGERHNFDTSLESMDLLRLLVINEQDFLNRGINLRGIILLGQYLRDKGDLVDFIKLDKWLLRLHLQRMVQLQGSILMSIFGFEADELPFLHREEPRAFKLTVYSVENLAKDTAQEWHLRQTNTGFVSNNSVILRRNLGRSIRYLPYATLETICSFFKNLAKSLKEIEE